MPPDETAAQPVTMADFAGKVRAKYPGSYDHLSDSELTGKIITKYPEYKDQISGMAKTQFEKDRPGEGISLKGSGTAAWNTLKGAASGLVKQIDPTSGLSGAGLTGIGLNPRSGTASERLNEVPAVRAYKEAKAGFHRGGLDEAGNSAVGALAGVSGESMAQHGERGEGGAIIGEAAVPAATAALAPVIGEAASGLKKLPGYVGSIVRDPATGKVRTPYEMAIDKIAPDPYKPTAIPAKSIPRGTNYGQHLEEQKVAARQQKAQEAATVGPEEVAATAQREALAAGKNAPGPWKPGIKPIPKPEPVRTTPFEGMSSSASPLAQIELPPVPETPAKPFPKVLSRKELEPTPELGSPENPGMHSKIPTRMPRTIGARPEPPAAEGPAPSIGPVVKLPVPREPMPGENPGYMASIPRARLLDLARQGRPGAGQQLQNIGKKPLYVPESYPQRLQKAGVEAEPELELVEAHSGPRGNGSGAPGGGGLEEQARMESNKANGTKYYRENAGGQRVEIKGLGAQDAKASPGQRIIQVNGHGHEIVLDEKSVSPRAIRPLRGRLE